MTNSQPSVPQRPRFAVLTPPGRGAIATIAVRGTGCLPLVARLFRPASGKPLTEFPVGRSVFGRFEIPLSSGERAGRRPAGESSHTSEDLVIGLLASDELEIHCHGGKAAVEAICDALTAEGATQISSTAWAHQQAADPIAADALLALTTARTERTAAILLDQFRGALRRELNSIDNALSKNDVAAAKTVIDQLLAHADLGLHLTKPWKVVIAGRPNAGKSSLMNALLGYERSIVWRDPGTTRDVLTATTAIDGWPIELTDTAGLRDVGRAVPATDPIESEGISRARSQITTADLIIFVADTTAPWDGSLHQQVAAATHRPLLIVHNKCDVALPPEDGRPDGIETSAVTSSGLNNVCHAIDSALVPAPPPLGAALPFTRAQVAYLEAAQRELTNGNLSAIRRHIQMTDYNEPHDFTSRLELPDS
jgi:tRNA modification GTPase